MATANEFGWYIATDNGVDKNVSADQSTAINQLFADVVGSNPGGGGLIYFETGTYTVGAPLSITASNAGSSIAIVGAGWTGPGSTGTLPGTEGGTVFQTTFPFVSGGNGDVFTYAGTQGGGVYFAGFSVDRITLLATNPTYKTTTTGFSIPPVGSTVNVPVSLSSGSTIPRFAYVRISDGTNTMYGYITAGNGTATWTVENTSSSGSAISSGATVTMQAPTAGATFYLAEATNVLFDQIYTNGDFDFLELGTRGASGAWGEVFLRNCVANSVVNNYAHIISGGNNFHASNCSATGLTNGSYVTGQNTALSVDLTSLDATAIISEVNWNCLSFLSFAKGIVFNESYGQLADSTFQNVNFQGTGSGIVGAYFFKSSPTQGGKITDSRIDGGFATISVNAPNAPCIYLDAGGVNGALQGISIHGVRGQGGSAAAALSLQNLATSVTVTGCEFYGSSVGIRIGGSGASHVVISGNNLGSVYSASQPNGIGAWILTSASGIVNDVVISGNQVSGNTSAGIAISATPANSLIQDVAVVGNTASGYAGPSTAIQIAGTVAVYGSTSGLVGVLTDSNTGYNPFGVPSSPPAVTTSAVLNPYTFPVRLFIAGGSGVSISITPAYSTSPVATGLTGGCFVLGVGEQITLSYTTAPTWKWFGL